MKQLWMLVLASVLCGALWACGDDDDGDNPDAGGGSGGAGGDGDGGGDWSSVEPNLSCPDSVPPLDGPGAQRGDCCYRNQPNSAKMAAFDEALMPGEQGDLTLGFRFNDNVAIHPSATLGAQPLPALAKTRTENYEQQLMVQFTFPRGKDADGNVENLAGDGSFAVGAGTYDCDDGTFMFYGDGAAPIIDNATYPGADTADRWHYRKLPAVVDPTITGPDRFQVSFEDRQATGFSYTSYVDATTDTTKFIFDWEIVTQGFDIIEFEWDDNAVDCYGELDGNAWTSPGLFVVFADLKNNNDPNNGISSVGGINFCTLISFGVGASALSPIPDCETEPRCMPGSTDCPWLALPNALCPETEDERAIFECHYGDENNVNGDTTAVANCTQDPPTAHSADSDGQCCDPLGESATLPACNAFRIVNEFTAASAVIKEELASTELQKCL